MAREVINCMKNKSSSLIIAFIYYMFIDQIIFFINAVTLSIIGPTPFDTILVYLVLGILLSRAILYNSNYKVSTPFLFIILFLIASIIIGFLLFYSYIEINLILRILFSSILCLLIVNELKNPKSLVETLLKTARPLLVIMLLGFLINLYIIRTEWNTNKMPFSYMLLAPTLLEIWKMKRHFKVFDLLLVLISFIILVIFGSRGPIFALIIYLILFLFLFSSAKRKFMYTLLLILVGIMLFSYIPNTLNFFYNMGLSLGVESKLLSLITQNDVFFDNGRFELFETTWNLIIASPLTGKGVFSDRYFLNNTYPHNLLFELLLNYGLILGSVIVIGIIYGITKSLLSKNVVYKELILFLFILGFVPLLFSGSFWTQKEFFALLGFSIFQNHQTTALKITI